jgi:hypothetical protein
MSETDKPDPRKKPYRTPTLETYGPIRELTRSVTGTGKNDTMSGNATKTG